MRPDQILQEARSPRCDPGRALVALLDMLLTAGVHRYALTLEDEDAEPAPGPVDEPDEHDLARKQLQELAQQWAEGKS